MSDSLITKNAIAASIKELMRKKPLQKISVADIMENSKINRQTFYYHFKDKYDLVDWIYYNEVVSAVTQHRTFKELDEVVFDVLNAMKKEQYFYTNAFSVTGQNAFQDYFFSVTKVLLEEIIDVLSQGQIENEDKDFIADFYAFGLVGIVIQWARRGMKQPPEQIVQRLTHFINDSKYNAAVRYLKEHEEEQIDTPVFKSDFD
ncbi:dihydroxyacetone kinase transcriptional activator DhaS [Caproiciproducens galactitolivorans]|uniref:Dihydroxyacetone kinase transcriptional activator DhaS n=1 Tax=Caproiciproducens galactitolivorans TaxID=642589 RepID=A0ABT4BQG8_9FIRM|nr:dihydroxyacetone kinase transcriptional activator DhaS [Caproiciproducens galactitolivorans]MCY1713135.1 dihydroxyacetone kinase transcriptional activator DhaS [Caproiciproducens galactitolivorans]